VFLFDWPYHAPRRVPHKLHWHGFPIADVGVLNGMKRRDFIKAAGLLGASAPALAQLRPCPPPVVSASAGSGSQSQNTTCEDVQDTKLAQIARSLSPGQSSTSLGDTGMSGSAAATIQWVNRFHYDHANSRAHLMGKNAASTGSARSNNVYNALTNTWTSVVYGGGELGHVYESTAYDPSRGELYSGTWNQARTLKRWTYGSSLSSWTDPVTSLFSAYIDPDVQPPLCWFPNAFGPGDGAVLALRVQFYDDESVIAWRRSNNTWYTVPGTSNSVSGSYQGNGAVVYCKSGNFCIATFPPGQGGRTFRIPAGSGGALASATQISNVPLQCGYAGGNEHVGMLFDDPAGSSTMYILEKGSSNRVWKYNNGNWAQQSFTHPFPRGGSSGGDTSWIVSSCNPIGVFWGLDNDSGSPSRIWKPNA
jgi:hypothetical protein